MLPLVVVSSFFHSLPLFNLRFCPSHLLTSLVIYLSLCYQGDSAAAAAAEPATPTAPAAPVVEEEAKEEEEVSARV